jgi:sugar (pentulose or hexulose) kinase
MPAFVGLDVGTQGARSVAVALSGEQQDDPEAQQGAGAAAARAIASATYPFPAGTTPSDLPPRYVEQRPDGWWQAALACLRQVTTQLGEAGVSPQDVGALSVTSTSGTLCLLNEAGEPLIPALMYNDSRAGEEAAEVQAAGSELANCLGYRFNASFALAKLLWVARHQLDILERARYIAHAADFITGRLCGAYDVTDYSNALKTGCDLAPQGRSPIGCWPDFIGGKLALPVHKLPRVIAPGEVIGTVTARAAAESGLRAGTPVVAGMTDGCAAQIAAGAVAPGDWSSTLGTTLVIKGVTEDLMRDPQGRIYSHRHPDGYWLPGGASNTGGEILESRFPGADLVALDRRAAELSPTDLVAYPLARRGERFPFVRAGAEGFVVPFGGAPKEAAEEASPETLFASYLEGVAYLERLAYETLVSLGAQVGDVIRVAGGGARSDDWLQIRSDVLDRALLRPTETSAAMGAAILAASRTHFDGLIPAARAVVRADRRVEPRPAMSEHYEARYRAFLAACAERGYVDNART